jgi:hypothetical protein
MLHPPLAKTRPETSCTSALESLPEVVPEGAAGLRVAGHSGCRRRGPALSRPWRVRSRVRCGSSRLVARAAPTAFSEPGLRLWRRTRSRTAPESALRHQHHFGSRGAHALHRGARPACRDAPPILPLARPQEHRLLAGTPGAGRAKPAAPRRVVQHVVQVQQGGVARSVGRLARRARGAARVKSWG